MSVEETELMKRDLESISHGIIASYIKYLFKISI